MQLSIGTCLFRQIFKREDMKEIKPIRLITNRDFPDGKSVEWIEINSFGFMTWKADDYSMKDNIVSCAFPVDLEFVEEFFQKMGRVLEKTKLPENVVFDPYKAWK